LLLSVHFESGSGHTEAVYKEAMCVVMTEACISFQRERPLAVHLHGRIIGSFRADIVVESKIILEFKAGSRLENAAETQLLNYLRVTEIEVGLLLHFGPRASFKRRVMSNERKSLRVSSAPVA
jgi:GxxExxY protein